MDAKPNTLISFFRYNIVAGIATAVDFALLILLTEVFQFWYLFSAFMGAVSGGITSFVLERNWTFMKKDGSLSAQATKYILVWILSILLNVGGLYLFVEFLGFQYIVSKIMVAIIVGIGFNFLMHKNFIFK